jgi:hypothetical protein
MRWSGWLMVVQRRRGTSADSGTFVEPDDGQVIGHGEPECALPRRSWLMADRSLAANTAGRPVGALEQLAGWTLGGFGPIPTHPDECLVDGPARVGHGPTEAGLAQPRRLEILAAAEEADASMAQPE